MTTAIIIPTRGRSHKLGDLLQNLYESSESPYKVYFVVDRDDEATVNYLKERTDCVMVVNEVPPVKTPSNYNKGFLATTEPLVAVMADDYVFPQGWLRKAVQQLGDKSVLAFADKYAEGWGVFLLRREWIEKECVIDEPGKIFHEYFHEFADAELQFSARWRNQIVYSDIELQHMNPKRLGVIDQGIVQHQLLSFYHPALSEYDIKSIEKKADRLDVILVPRNPLVFDETYQKNSQKEGVESDMVEFAKRAILWGGQTKENLFKKDVKK